METSPDHWPLSEEA